ncbi:hypothetical protein KA405_01960, partial [Patescibacteria group bacterium]|nr:hypothetical protein [Patescibacteria group bacterium]
LTSFLSSLLYSSFSSPFSSPFLSSNHLIYSIVAFAVSGPNQRSTLISAQFLFRNSCKAFTAFFVFVQYFPSAKNSHIQASGTKT